MLRANSPDWNLDEAPLVVIREITRACALACKHCLADATVRRDPKELTFEEGCRILDQAKAFGWPVVVLTGGDLLLRSDFNDLIRYGTSLGLRISASPSGTKFSSQAAALRG